MSFACHLHVTCMRLYFTYMYACPIRVSVVCTRMSSVCHFYVLVCHPYVTSMYSCVIRMSLVCNRMLSVCHSYVLVCYSYVTRMYSYVIRMSLICGFTMNSILKSIRMIFWLCWNCYEWLLQFEPATINIYFNSKSFGRQQPCVKHNFSLEENWNHWNRIQMVHTPTFHTNYTAGLGHCN